MATFISPFLRLVAEVGCDGAVGHHGRCVEGVGVYDRLSGQRVVICGQGRVWDGQPAAAENVLERREFGISLSQAHDERN